MELTETLFENKICSGYFYNQYLIILKEQTVLSVRKETDCT